MQLNPSEISELIKSRISGVGAGAEVRNQGTVISVTDGICRVHGLSGVMQGEMLEFPNNTLGLALNLERDSVGRPDDMTGESIVAFVVLKGQRPCLWCGTCRR